MKAQTSMETILITIIIFIVFAMMLSLTISKQLENDNIKKALQKTNACDAFANEVKSVFVLGNGTKSAVSLDYNINVSGKTAVIDSVICKICCNLTKNSSMMYTLNTGPVKLENKDGNVFLAGPKIVAVARYTKPAHTFFSDETAKVISNDGTFVNINKDNRVLHVAFDIPVNGRITALLRCDVDGAIQLKTEGLGSVISSSSCSGGTWMWVNLTNAAGSVFDLNSDNADVDYDAVDVIW